MSGFAPLLERSIEIDSSPDHVWGLIRDVRQMAEWSPQVSSSRLRSGWDCVGPGAQFTNLNRHDDLEWVTHGEIVRFSAHREIAFRIEENRVIWSFRIEALAGGGTRLTQRREAPEGISAESRRLTDDYMGGQEAFTRTMLDGMRSTLERIKTTAEEVAREGEG